MLEGLEHRAVPSTLGMGSGLARRVALLAQQATNNEITNPTGVPTAHERLRQRFHATFSGFYVVGPGRFSSQASQISVRGAGRSNCFLHGEMLMKVATPKDPTQPTTGAMTMFDRNMSNGSQLGLLLTAVPGAVDSHGRPTRFTFETDSDVSGGAFTASSGEGILTVRYQATGRSGGRAFLVARGNVYTLGTVSNQLTSEIDP